ncbi:MAG: hypothetical protein K1X74_10225 [Pirellulales bacterium]|nr:hypothetical protein [Pirellulales bacterium]
MFTCAHQGLRYALALCGVVALVSNGCSHNSKSSSVTQATSPTPVTGTNLSGIDLGRALYTGRCTECHSAKKITSYSPSEWNHLIDDMSGRASLNSTERQALSDYVYSVLGN